MNKGPVQPDLFFFFQRHMGEDGHDHFQHAKAEIDINPALLFGAVAAMADSDQDIIANTPGEVEAGKKEIGPLRPDPGNQEEHESDGAHENIHQSGFPEPGALRNKSTYPDSEIGDGDPGQPAGKNNTQCGNGTDLVKIACNLFHNTS